MPAGGMNGDMVLAYYEIMDVNKARALCLQGWEVGTSAWQAGSWHHLLHALDGPLLNSPPCTPLQWICMVILACMAVFYRTLFFAALKYKEWKTM